MFTVPINLGHQKLKSFLLNILLIALVTSCGGSSELDLEEFFDCLNSNDPNCTNNDNESITPIEWPNPAWPERGLHVAVDGTDYAGCGDLLSPCRTIRYAMSELPDTNDPYSIYVHPGIYDEGRSIYMRNYTRLLAVDGPQVTKIYTRQKMGVRFTGQIDLDEGIDNPMTNGELNGFDVYGDYNQGTEGDGLIRVYQANNIAIKNCILHDAPFDADVIKVSGYVENLLVENSIIYNPAHRTSSNSSVYQENLDIFGSQLRRNGNPAIRNVVIRGNWMFHTPDKKGDTLMYGKVDVENFVIENNVFGPSRGVGYVDFPDDRTEEEGKDGRCVAIGVSGLGSGPNAGVPRESTHRHSVVRNNFFFNCMGDAALAITDAGDVWVYNNMFYDNSGDQTRSIIQLQNAHPEVGLIMGKVNLFNNIFQSNHPNRKDDGLFYRLRNVKEDAIPSPFFKDYNYYYDNVVDRTDYPYTGEPNSLYESQPAYMVNLPSPLLPSQPSLSDIANMKASFTLSNSGSIKGKGLNAYSLEGHPNWKPGLTDIKWDMLKAPRSETGAWDLGPFVAP